MLAICARFKNHEAMKLLVDAKALVNSKAVHTPLGTLAWKSWKGPKNMGCLMFGEFKRCPMSKGVACLANDAHGVKLLCEAKADPHARNPFGHLVTYVNHFSGAKSLR